MKGDMTKFMLEMQAFLRQVREIEEAAAVVKNTRSIDAALQYGIARGWGPYSNPVLDDIGDIVGRPRYGQTNAAYAILLKAKIQMNASKGEPERIIAATRVICQTTIIKYTEYYPATVIIEFESATVPDGLITMMERVVSGGVRINMVNIDPEAFAFSDTQDDMTGDTVRGFAPDDQSYGGRLSRVL